MKETNVFNCTATGQHGVSMVLYCCIDGQFRQTTDNTITVSISAPTSAHYLNIANMVPADFKCTNIVPTYPMTLLALAANESVDNRYKQQ